MIAAALLVAGVSGLNMVERRGLVSWVVASEMKTSSDFSSFQDVTGQTKSNLGPGTISGKSRPVTNVILAEEPESRGGAIFADLVLTNSQVARVTFSPASSVKLAKGFYYDVEARSKNGDSSYVHVARPGDTASLVASVLSTEGRYGAFGAPTDVKIDEAGGVIDVSFSAMAPGGASVPRHAYIAVAKAEGSPDVLLLVSSASQARWDSGGREVAKEASTSFRVDSTRPTKLAATKESDFRFEQRGGFRGD